MTVPRALVVDDEADLRELIVMALMPLGIECLEAADVATAQQLLQHTAFDVCLTDLRLPDGSGLELVSACQGAAVPVAVISAHGNVEIAVEALKLGAFDFIAKPFELQALRQLVTSVLQLQRTVLPSQDHVAPRLLGQSPSMCRVRDLIARLSRSQAPVLISGESGTGKELAARAIHDAGPRAAHPFVPVNCGAIPEQLLESEFFGHRKGAFTGAMRDHDGLFQSASGGTLFLDEVADLPLSMQVKLLRAIQERAVRPVGANQELPVDVRILSASHKPLARLVERGQFRQDLYYRLNVIELPMPALRERREDIALLAQSILARLAEAQSFDVPQFAPAALQVLQQYAFPGNVRELENVLERALTLCVGSHIEVHDLQLTLYTQADETPETSSTPAQNGSAFPDDLEAHLAEVERRAILAALEATDQNKTAAAERLGISFRALRYRLKKLGLD